MKLTRPSSWMTEKVNRLCLPKRQTELVPHWHTFMVEESTSNKYWTFLITWLTLWNSCTLVIYLTCVTQVESTLTPCLYTMSSNVLLLCPRIMAAGGHSTDMCHTKPLAQTTKMLHFSGQTPQRHVTQCSEHQFNYWTWDGTCVSWYVFTVHIHHIYYLFITQWLNP